MPAPVGSRRPACPALRGSADGTERTAHLYDRKLTVRVSFEELRHLRPRAREAVLSLSRYLVASGLAGCPPPLSAEDRALRQRAIFHARKIGVNLNQIARQLNSGEPVSGDRLTETIVAAKEALALLTGRGTG